MQKILREFQNDAPRSKSEPLLLAPWSIVDTWLRFIRNQKKRIPKKCSELELQLISLNFFRKSLSGNLKEFSSLCFVVIRRLHRLLNQTLF